MNGEKKLREQKEGNNTNRKEQEERTSFPSIITSVRDNCEEYENRLHFWLKLEHWTLQEAAALIADIDPESIELTPDQRSFANARTLRESDTNPEEEGEDGAFDENNGDLVTNDLHDQEAHLKLFYRRVKDTERILGGIHPKLEVATPEEWVNVALARGIQVPWLHWAKRVRLIEIPATRVSQTEKPLGEKERLSMLKIIAALSEMEKLDKNMAFKNAKVIQNQCFRMGFEISENTIVKYLKAAGALIPENSPGATNSFHLLKNN